MSIVNPIQRNLKFLLPADRVTDWHADGVHVSQFLNTLSLFFPQGERFFIESVRHYRDQIVEPELKASVKAFIAQEAMHGREHQIYNDAMEAAGFPIKAMEAHVTRRLKHLQKVSSPAYCLAVTVALEHLTAIMADALLKSPAALADAEPRFKALWEWHALEETEHKAVAFDVYQQVVGTGVKAYMLRCATLVMATTIFFSLCTVFYLRILRRSRALTNLRGWWSLTRHLWLRPGVFRKALPAWFAWFKPGFHPWQHDNRHHLDQLDELVARVDAFGNQQQAA